MTSRFSARITVDAGDRTEAIYESVRADDESYPENPVSTEIRMDGHMTIDVESDHLPHLRANLNSTLRLVQASHSAIESAGR